MADLRGGFRYQEIGRKKHSSSHDIQDLIDSCPSPRGPLTGRVWRRQLGQSGHWGAASPTAAISRSTVVALGLGSNDRSALQATSGIDPLRPVRLFTSRAASLRQPPLTLLGGCVTRHLATFESPAHRCRRPQVYEKPSRCRLPDLK